MLDDAGRSVGLGRTDGGQDFRPDGFWQFRPSYRYVSQATIDRTLMGSKCCARRCAFHLADRIAKLSRLFESLIAHWFKVKQVLLASVQHVA
jgi:hypothetical protein